MDMRDPKQSCRGCRTLAGKAATSYQNSSSYDLRHGIVLLALLSDRSMGCIVDRCWVSVIRGWAPPPGLGEGLTFVRCIRHDNVMTHSTVQFTQFKSPIGKHRMLPDPDDYRQGEMNKVSFRIDQIETVLETGLRIPVILTRSQVRTITWVRNQDQHHSCRLGQLASKWPQCAAQVRCTDVRDGAWVVLQSTFRLHSEGSWPRSVLFHPTCTRCSHHRFGIPVISSVELWFVPHTY